MSIIPGITDSRQKGYTVVGGNEALFESNISLVLLNRGGRYMLKTVLEQLDTLGFDQIFSIEPSLENWEIEELALNYPRVRFVMLSGDSSPGERINIAASEMKSERFLVVWNDLCQVQGADASKIAVRLKESNEVLLAPPLLNSRYEAAAVVKNPVLVKGTVKIVPTTSLREGLDTLYPHDYVGLYHRESFLSVDGFDPSISSSWVQLLDFGFRCRLQGKLIKTTQAFKLICDTEVPTEDQTAHVDVNRFWLKNIAPVFHSGAAHLPWRRFLSYLLRAGENPFEAWKEFKEIREWVSLNRFRFLSDAKQIIDEWENPEL